MQNSDKTFLYERLKKEFGQMKFDVVIGNHHTTKEWTWIL